jgi:hypothetical protein
MRFVEHAARIGAISNQTNFWPQNPKQIDRLRDLGIDEDIITDLNGMVFKDTVT